MIEILLQDIEKEAEDQSCAAPTLQSSAQSCGFLAQVL